MKYTSKFNNFKGGAESDEAEGGGFMIVVVIVIIVLAVLAALYYFGYFDYFAKTSTLTPSQTNIIQNTLTPTQTTAMQNNLQTGNTTAIPNITQSQSTVLINTLAPTLAPTQVATLVATLAPTLTPTQIATLAPTLAPTSAPTSALTSAPTLVGTNVPLSTSYTDSNGTIHTVNTESVTVTGSEIGSMWGGECGIYTNDSSLDRAAVHQGFVQVGETKTIFKRDVGNLAKYDPVTKNGISSYGFYGMWNGVQIWDKGVPPALNTGGSCNFSLPTTAPTATIAPTATTAPTTAPAPPFTSYKDASGTIYTNIPTEQFSVTGVPSYMISAGYGGVCGVYTSDSDFNWAATQQGLVAPNETKTIYKRNVGLYPSYESLTQNEKISWPYPYPWAGIQIWGGGNPPELTAYPCISTDMTYKPYVL